MYINYELVVLSKFSLKINYQTNCSLSIFVSQCTSDNYKIRFLYIKKLYIYFISDIIFYACLKPHFYYSIIYT